MTEVPDLWLLVIAVLAITISAVLSAGEAALLRLSRPEAAELVAEGKRGSARVQRLVNEPGPALSAVGFVRLGGEMTTAVCLTLVLYSTIGVWWQAFLAAIAATVLIALLLIGFSPRAYGRAHAAPVLLALGPLFTGAERVFSPVTRIFGRVHRGASERRSLPALSTVELRDMVDRVYETDELEDEEREMIHSVFELGDTRTREVMVPRTDMVTIASQTPLRKALTLFVRSGFSRIPVVGESVDDLLGVLYVKDVLRRLQSDPDDAETPVDRVMRHAVFVPESKPVDDLLHQMQAESTHVALVVDEYGGIAGLVTIEDALEEIVGELTDEHDHDTQDVEELGDGSFRVPARLPVDELGELFGLDLDDPDVDSTGGLLAKSLGKVPIPGATAEVGGLKLVAERAEGRRKQIATVIVSRVADDAVFSDASDLARDDAAPEKAPSSNGSGDVRNNEGGTDHAASGSAADRTENSEK